jgi:hypothetical protein
MQADSDGASGKEWPQVSGARPEIGCHVELDVVQKGAMS